MSRWIKSDLCCIAFDIKQYVTKCKREHKKIPYSKIGEYLKYVSSKDIAKLISAFAEICSIECPTNHVCNNVEEFCIGTSHIDNKQENHQRQASTIKPSKQSI